MVPAPARSAPDRILEAAKSMFASLGYENTTTSKIARTAGSSESQLVKYFGGKDGLLEAIFTRAWQGITWNARQALQRQTLPKLKLQMLIETFLNSIDKDPALKVLLLFEGRRLRKDGRMVLLDAGFLEFVRLTDEILLEMHEAGELRSEVHLEGARAALIGAMEGLLRDQLLAQRVGFPARFNGRELRETLWGVLSCFLVPNVAVARARRG